MPMAARSSATATIHKCPNFTDEEAKAICDETHRLGHKVAAHAGGREAIEQALKAGVDSIEHGNGMDAPLIDLLIAKGAAWCPTIYIYSRGGRNNASTDLRATNFKLAVQKGAKIVYGTDIGGYAWTESQTADFPYMVKWGMTTMQANSIRHPGRRYAARSAGSLWLDRSR